MSKDSKQHTKIITLLKRKYPKTYVAKGSWAKMTDIFLVASPQDGILFVKALQGKIIEIDKKRWSELPQTLYANQKQGERHYLHNEEAYLSVENISSDGKNIVRLIEDKRRILLFSTPWYQKIYGFRSGSMLKATVSSIFYSFVALFMMMILLVSCIGIEDTPSNKLTEDTQDIVAVADISEGTKDNKEQEEAKAQAEAEAKAQAEAEAEAKAKAEAEAEAEAATTTQTEFFENCTALREVYPNGVDVNHPAYQSKMDRDKDNFACER